MKSKVDKQLLIIKVLAFSLVFTIQLSKFDTELYVVWK